MVDSEMKLEKGKESDRENDKEKGKEEKGKEKEKEERNNIEEKEKEKGKGEKKEKGKLTPKEKFFSSMNEVNEASPKTKRNLTLLMYQEFYHPKYQEQQ